MKSVLCVQVYQKTANQFIVLKQKILVVSEMEIDRETNCKLIEKIS